MSVSYGSTDARRPFLEMTTVATSTTSTSDVHTGTVTTPFAPRKSFCERLSLLVRDNVKKVAAVAVAALLITGGFTAAIVTAGSGGCPPGERSAQIPESGRGWVPVPTPRCSCVPVNSTLPNC